VDLQLVDRPRQEERVIIDGEVLEDRPRRGEGVTVGLGAEDFLTIEIEAGSIVGRPTPTQGKIGGTGRDLELLALGVSPGREGGWIWRDPTGLDRTAGHVGDPASVGIDGGEGIIPLVPPVQIQASWSGQGHTTAVDAGIEDRQIAAAAGWLPMARPVTMATARRDTARGIGGIDEP
jgi:hypothetical protein